MTASRWWTSDLSDSVIHRDGSSIPPASRFALEPYFDEQTMNVAEGEVKYWEGIKRIREENHTGKQIGIGYMELAGYAHISSEMNISA